MCHNVRWHLIGTNGIDDPVPPTQAHFVEKRASPVLLCIEITKCMSHPSQEAVVRPTRILTNMKKDMGPLASMPGGPEDVGTLASMPGGPDEIAMLAGDSGRSAAAFVFRSILLLHTKASSGDTKAQSAPRQFAHCACYQ